MYTLFNDSHDKNSILIKRLLQSPYQTILQKYFCCWLILFLERSFFRADHTIFDCGNQKQFQAVSCQHVLLFER